MGQPSYPAYPHRQYYLIRCRMNGLVLDIEGVNTQPGARVILWTQKGSDNNNQLWYDDPYTGTIRSKLNDFCLDIRST
jgi:Ricin-type beta-trefoil lectin domain-like